MERTRMAQRCSRSSLPALVATAFAAVVLALAAPTMASAATTIGADLTNSPQSQNTCNGSDPGTTSDCTLTPLTEVGRSVAAPSEGVITRWRVVGGSGPMVLRVVRPQAGGKYLFVSTSAVETPANTGVVTFNTQQPVLAGDYIAIELKSTTARIGIDSSSVAPAGTSSAVFIGQIADGAIVAPVMIADKARGYVDADVEADADHDGFGDETQDQCPTNAAVQGPCPPPPPPPDTTPPKLRFAAAHAHLSRNGRVSFFLSSNENATGTVTATLSLPKSAKVVRFVRGHVHLKAGTKTKVTLRLSKRSTRSVRAVLKKRKHLTASVTFRLKDAAGNLTTRKLHLRISR